jgi:hypothetical protein
MTFDRPLGKNEKAWLEGQDVYIEDDQEANRHINLQKIMPVEYVKTQLNILEDVANDLRRQSDELRNRIKEMRKLISEDDF